MLSSLWRRCWAFPAQLGYTGRCCWPQPAPPVASCGACTRAWGSDGACLLQVFPQQKPPDVRPLKLLSVERGKLCKDRADLEPLWDRGPPLPFPSRPSCSSLAAKTHGGLCSRHNPLASPWRASSPWAQEWWPLEWKSGDCRAHQPPPTPAHDGPQWS